MIARKPAIHTTARFRFHDLVTRTLRFVQGEWTEYRLGVGMSE